MASRQRIGTEFLSGCQKIGKLDSLVAGNAGNRRLAHRIGFGERIDHRLTEPLFVIQHVMRNAERFADAARIVDILTGAARTGAVNRSPMIVKLQRDA
ncbi:hypothetical protein D3C80_654930 [compost metagenome]